MATTIEHLILFGFIWFYPMMQFAWSSVELDVEVDEAGPTIVSVGGIVRFADQECPLTFTVGEPRTELIQFSEAFEPTVGEVRVMRAAVQAACGPRTWLGPGIVEVIRLSQVAFGEPFQGTVGAELDIRFFGEGQSITLRASASEQLRQPGSPRSHEAAARSILRIGNMFTASGDRHPGVGHGENGGSPRSTGVTADRVT